MKLKRLVVECTIQEKSILKKLSSRFGFSLSEYVKRKLFNENEDLVSNDGKFISPYADKNHVINISLLYKTLHLVKEVLIRLDGVNPEDVIEAERKALEYARKEREKCGYKHIRPDNE